MTYQLFKNGIPVAVAHSAEECDRLYLEYNCDEVRGYEVDDSHSEINVEKEVLSNP